jgi:hypothetical protein
MIYFIAILAVVVVAYVLMARATRKRSLRATATITISSPGNSMVTFVPEAVSGQELVRMALAYVSKLRWVLIHQGEETQGLQESFRDLTEKVLDSWFWHQGPVEDGAPPAAEIMRIGPQAVAEGGERFVVRYFRMARPNGMDRSFASHDLPRPVTAANLVWHYVLLLGAIEQRLTTEERAVAGKAFRTWWNQVFKDSTPDGSPSGLMKLNSAADLAWAEASREAM